MSVLPEANGPWFQVSYAYFFKTLENIGICSLSYIAYDKTDFVPLLILYVVGIVGVAWSVATGPVAALCLRYWVRSGPMQIGARLASISAGVFIGVLTAQIATRLAQTI